MGSSLLGEKQPSEFQEEKISLVVVEFVCLVEIRRKLWMEEGTQSASQKPEKLLF